LVTLDRPMEPGKLSSLATACRSTKLAKLQAFRGGGIVGLIVRRNMNKKHIFVHIQSCTHRRKHIRAQARGRACTQMRLSTCIYVSAPVQPPQTHNTPPSSHLLRPMPNEDISFCSSAPSHPKPSTWTLGSPKKSLQQGSGGRALSIYCR